MADEIIFDGRTLGVTVVIDIWDQEQAFQSGVIVHGACRGPLERLVIGFSKDATPGERTELGELLLAYDVTTRGPGCVRHKFLVNTDEGTEAVAIRVRAALAPKSVHAMIIVGECDTTEAAKVWARARQHRILRQDVL